MSFLDFLIPTAYAPNEEMAKEFDIANNSNLGSSCLECNQSNKVPNTNVSSSESTSSEVLDSYSVILNLTISMMMTRQSKISFIKLNFTTALSLTGL